MLAPRNPHILAVIHPTMTSQDNPKEPLTAAERDAQSDPEPPAPSLPEPDPGVFHHEPAAPAPTSASKDKR